MEFPSIFRGEFSHTLFVASSNSYHICATRAKLRNRSKPQCLSTYRKWLLLEHGPSPSNQSEKASIEAWNIAGRLSNDFMVPYSPIPVHTCVILEDVSFRPLRLSKPSFWSVHWRGHDSNMLFAEFILKVLAWNIADYPFPCATRPAIFYLLLH